MPASKNLHRSGGPEADRPWRPFARSLVSATASPVGVSYRRPAVCSRSASRSRIRAAPRQRGRRPGSCAVRKIVLQTLPLTSIVPCRFLSDKQSAASGPRQLSLCCWMFSIRNETTRQTSLADLHHAFFTRSLHQPSGLISPVTDLQDFSATNRLQSAHFFPSSGLGLYDTAFSCPYTIRTSASAYFSEDLPSTKLKYDARAAI